MNRELYLVAVGSNQRHRVIGPPRKVVNRAMEIVDGIIGDVVARSPIIDSDPIGPSQRRYANAAMLIETDLDPWEMLESLQYTERQLGRVRRGQRWRSRVIDLDIVLWSGGTVAGPDLVIPHPLFRQREFVLGPAAAIAAAWRDPVTGLSLQQLHARLTGHRPVPR